MGEERERGEVGGEREREGGGGGEREIPQTSGV